MMSLLPTPAYKEQHITIFDIKLVNFKLSRSSKQPSTLRIDIIPYNSNLKVSQLAKEISDNGKVVWDKAISIYIAFESGFKLRVVRVRKYLPDKIIGEYVFHMPSFINTPNPLGTYNIHELTFSIKNADVEKVLEVTDAGGSSPADTWSMLLHCFKIVKIGLDPLSKLFPYNCMILYLLSKTPKVTETSPIILELIQDMVDIYKYVMHKKHLPVLSILQRESLGLLLQQTHECTRFLKDIQQLSPPCKKDLFDMPFAQALVQEYKLSFEQLFDIIKCSKPLPETKITVVEYSPFGFATAYRNMLLDRAIANGIDIDWAMNDSDDDPVPVEEMFYYIRDSST